MNEGFYSPVFPGLISGRTQAEHIEFSLEALGYQVEDKYGKTIHSKPQEVAQIDALSYLYAYLSFIELNHDKEVDMTTARDLENEEIVRYRFAINSALVSDKWKLVAHCLTEIGHTMYELDDSAFRIRQGNAFINMARAVMGR